MAKYGILALAAVAALSASNADAFAVPRSSASAANSMSGALRMSAEPLAYPATADDILWTPSWKTGARDEAVGRSCRFLQGPQSDPDAINTIRQVHDLSTSLEHVT